MIHTGIYFSSNFTQNIQKKYKTKSAITVQKFVLASQHIPLEQPKGPHFHNVISYYIQTSDYTSL